MRRRAIRENGGKTGKTKAISLHENEKKIRTTSGRKSELREHNENKRNM